MTDAARLLRLLSITGGFVPSPFDQAARPQGNDTNIYDRLFKRRIDASEPQSVAYTAVANAYLAGQPDRIGRRKVTAVHRHGQFWSSPLWLDAPEAALLSEPFVLALAQYFQQTAVSAIPLLRRVADRAPDSLKRAIRYSLIFVRRDSGLWQEIEQLELRQQPEYESFFEVCDRINSGLDELVKCASEREAVVTAMHPVEVLAYASLFAFGQMLPPLAEGASEDARLQFEAGAEAISQLLTSTVRRCDEAKLQLSESDVAKAIFRALSPILFPTEDEPTGEESYRALKDAISHQASANAFRAHWVKAFAFDDDRSFKVVNEALLADTPAWSSRRWQTNGRKLELLHHYWFSRAFEEALSEPSSLYGLDDTDNSTAKLLGHLRARRDLLQLTEVYGIDANIEANNGAKVDLIDALRTLEFLTAFFTLEFVQPFLKQLALTGSWRIALRSLAMTGVQQDAFHIRFPLTWARRRDKIERLKQWTTSVEYPRGNAKAMESVLDFWTQDLTTLRTQSAPRDMPELHERPLLKLGGYLFQLPWMMAAQNNANASINNLRRIGSRRAAVKDETRRVEHRLSERLRERGFHVRPNYQPVHVDVDDAGEVDIVCARDNHLFILELKSTFVRKSLEDAWRHRTTGLRRAAAQLNRKVAAVTKDLAGPLSDLQIDVSTATLHAWIVDTCLEYDHENIDGFLKVSLQEILIALRDDRHLLQNLMASPETAFEIPPRSTLYQDGFSGGAFAAAIESSAVWANVIE